MAQSDPEFARLGLSGSTRIIPIVGDPIAQVKSPGGMTAAFMARGVNAICIPMQIAPQDFGVFMQLVRLWRNCDGVIVTVPHKLAAAEACDTTSERAGFLGSVNTIRRAPSGRLHGDMFDGLGFVAACQDTGCVFEGRRVLLVGAGGAGTAIAHAVASAGVARLGIADVDGARRDVVVGRLAAAGMPAEAADGTAAGYDIVLNATPMGMRPGDPLPVPVAEIAASTFVGDAVTDPDPSPLIAAARAKGCATSTGGDMFDKVRDLMIDFLLAGR